MQTRAIIRSVPWFLNYPCVSMPGDSLLKASGSQCCSAGSIPHLCRMGTLGWERGWGRGRDILGHGSGWWPRWWPPPQSAALPGWEGVGLATGRDWTPLGAPKVRCQQGLCSKPSTQPRSRSTAQAGMSLCCPELRTSPKDKPLPCHQARATWSSVCPAKGAIWEKVSFIPAEQQGAAAWPSSGWFDL